MKKRYLPTMNLRPTELLSTIVAAYWLFLTLLPSRIGVHVQSYRALTAVAPDYVWLVFFAFGVVAQQMSPRAPRNVRIALRICTSLIWVGIGVLEARFFHTIGPNSFLLWAIAMVLLRSVAIDVLHLPIAYQGEGR